MIERARDHNRPSLLRWMFQRGDDRIVCQIDAVRSVMVSLTSQGGPVRTLCEKFDDMLPAFERHAQLARQLRDYGWTVASYGR